MAVQAVGAVCPSCGREIGGDSRFCRWCRQFLIEKSAPLKAAGVGKRFAAQLVEAIVAAVVVAVFVIIGAAIDPGASVVLLVLACLGLLIWTLVLWGQGQSIGKMILKIRVIRTDGQPAGFWRMALREIIGKFVSGFFLYLGYFWAIWDKDQQTWHDKIAETVVVSENP